MSFSEGPELLPKTHRSKLWREEGSSVLLIFGSSPQLGSRSSLSSVALRDALLDVVEMSAEEQSIHVVALSVAPV